MAEYGSLLLVDDDKPFLTRLARAMESRGFDVDTAETITEAMVKVNGNAPDYAACCFHSVEKSSIASTCGQMQF